MLEAVRQKVLDPGTDGGEKAQVKQFGDKDVRDDAIKCRAKVNEKYPDVALLLFQVAQRCVGCYGDSIFS